MSHSIVQLRGVEGAERLGGQAMHEAGTGGTVRHELPAAWNEITRRIIACAIEVHSEIGPGLLESLYEQAMVVELSEAGLRVERQRPLRLKYKGRELGDLRLDLVVEDRVVVELKVLERVLEIHQAQLLSYLRSADLPLGLLINFAHPRLIDGVSRKINDRCTLVKALPLLPSGPPSLSALSEPSELKSARPLPGDTP